MITCCPRCGTAFRVSPEQLAARDGKVRCGRCAAIFDARQTIQEAGAEPSPQTGEGDVESVVPPSAGPESLPPEPAEAIEEPGDADESPGTALEDGPGSEDEPAPFTVPEQEPRGKGRRRLWLAGSVLLVLVLLGQIAMRFRGEIALVFPGSRSTIRELCAFVGCDVPLPRHAELIGIESSDLQADPSNPAVMVLTATLRNRAMFPQSHPALELTLTDSQDQPVARRVLAPRDYLGQGASLEPGFPPNSELPVKVFLEASSLKATGYRLYLFYP